MMRSVALLLIVVLALVPSPVLVLSWPAHCSVAPGDIACLGRPRPCLFVSVLAIVSEPRAIVRSLS